MEWPMSLSSPVSQPSGGKGSTPIAPWKVFVFGAAELPLSNYLFKPWAVNYFNYLKNFTCVWNFTFSILHDLRILL